MHKKWIRRICLPRYPFAILCLGSAPILDPRSRSRSGLLTQISNSDLGLGFSNGIVKSIRQFHQNRSRSIRIWSFRGYFDDMKHKVDPTDPTPINWGDMQTTTTIGDLWVPIFPPCTPERLTVTALSCSLQIPSCKHPQPFQQAKMGGSWTPF